MNYTKKKWQQVLDTRYVVKQLEDLMAKYKEKYLLFKGLLKNLEETEHLVDEMTELELITRKNCYKSYRALKAYYYKQIQITKPVLAHAKEEWHKACQL